MKRVKRNGRDRLLPSLPRRGRIRFVIAVIVTLLLVKFSVPSMEQLYSKNSDDESDTAAVVRTDTTTRVPEKKREKKEPDPFTRRQVFELIQRNQRLYGHSRAMVFFENDSFLVYTSIDTSLQEYLTHLMQRYHPLYGALAAMAPHSGRIYSLISYVNDSMPAPAGNLCFRSLFPAASVFKTVTAAAAIEHGGHTARCNLEHKGRSHTLYLSQIAPELEWSVDLTFAQAYARSINAVFARIGIYDLGAPALLYYSHRLGFNTRLPGELSCGISNAFTPDSTFDLAELASGFNQRTTISPLHGALIASTVAQDGSFPVPTLIDSIFHVTTGKKVFTEQPRTWLQSVAPSTAEELKSLMHAVVKKGTARKEFRHFRNSGRFRDFVYGGKTGSLSKDSVGRVDWFVGFASHPEKSDERIAAGVLTVHGDYWTVHSSYLAAEAFSTYLRSVQENKKTAAAIQNVSHVETGTLAQNRPQ